MMFPPKILKCALVFLTLLTGQGVSSGQSLYDVVISLSDRQRLLIQQEQVAIHLENEQFDQTSPITDDRPIDWVEVGENPTKSAVDGLGIADNTALLNQAVGIFDELKRVYLNSRPQEYADQGTVGTLKTYAAGDFDPLPRATPQNHQELLRLLALRVRALRLIRWPAAFNSKSHRDTTEVHEVVVYDDPEDENEDDSREPRVEIHDRHDEVVDTVSWMPDAIGPGNLESSTQDAGSGVSYGFQANLGVEGNYSQSLTELEGVETLIRQQRFELSASYPTEAKVRATAPGGDGIQIGGTVYILRRSRWHQIDIDDAATEFDETKGGYVVVGSGNSGSVPLFTSPPTATVNGEWVETSDNQRKFVEAGYQHKKAWTLPDTDPGHSNNYSHSYEQNWQIGCDFFSVFMPTFTRGVDAADMREKLESSARILAGNNASGELLLHPRPNLLFGIDLGAGLNGPGNGLISCGPQGDFTSHVNYFNSYVYDEAFLNYIYDFGLHLWDIQHLMPRFDSTYSLQFAGSGSDYHVVYENDRSGRAQSLPANSIGWPYQHSGGSTAQHDTNTLYWAWDSPRLKQVAGRYLVAAIDYSSSHYGGYTVKIYRRPADSPDPTPGEALSTSGMALIRTWTFSHPGADTTAHPHGSEELEATGSSGEKYEIKANHVLPNQGLGYADWFYGYDFWSGGGDWWWTEVGEWSWTLSHSQGTSDKLRKEIVVDTSLSENNFHESEVSVSRFCDGQEITSLTSATLNPFSDQQPADWEISTAGKTITGTASFGFGKWPTSVSIDYDGIQPDAEYTWDSKGLLVSASQDPWTTDYTVNGGEYKAVSKYNNSTIATTWTEFSDGGNKVTTYSAPDGGAGSKSNSSVAWTEVEYGTATNGLPGLPHKINRSDNTGSTFDWNIASDGAYTLTLEDGLVSGGSVSRGARTVRNVNARGFPVSEKSYFIQGGEVQTGGGNFSNQTPWGAPKKRTDYNTGKYSSWNFDSDLLRLASHTSLLGTASSYSGYDSLGRPGSTGYNGIISTNTYTGYSISSTLSGDGKTGSYTHTRDALGRLTEDNTTWNGVEDNLGLDHGNSSTGVTRSTLLGTYQASLRRDDGTAAAASGPTIPFDGTTGSGLSVDNGLLKTYSAYSGQSAASQSTWTDAWGRLRKTQTPKGSIDILHSNPSSTLRRVRVNEPSGRKLITESDPYDSSGSIHRSGIDVDGGGTLGSGDRYVESITSVSGGGIRTVLKRTENTGMREILRTTWNPNGNETVTTLNGSEETITRTPNYITKTINTTSSKGWSKTESFNNLGLTTNSNLTGTGIPAATLTPAWRDDGSLSGVTFTAGADSHSATFKNDGTLATLTAPGKGDILGGHTFSNGVETLTVDGLTMERKLDGTRVETNGGDVIGKIEELTTSGSGFKHTTTPEIGAATELVLNAAGASTAKTYAAGAGEGREYLSGGLLEKITLARGGYLIFGYSSDCAKDLTSATWPAVASGPITIPGIIQSYGHDRAGRVDEIGDASGARSLIHQNGRLKQTIWNSGFLAGYKVVRGIDDFGRQTGFELYRGNAFVHSAAKAPNGVSGEVSEITSGDVKIVVGRNAARQITGFQWGNATGTFVPVVTQTWDRGVAGRILSATSSVSGAPTFNYKGTANNESTAFDPKGRRLKCATAGAEWVYQYTNGRLTTAVHPTLGSFSYGFDGIGRRTDMGSANPSDLLNRTLAWTNSQNKTLKVAAHPDARVWVGIGTASPAEIPSFTGAYSYPITSPGTSGGWVAWNTLAVLTGQGDPGANPDAKAAQSGAVYFPPINESFTYDAAGNRESSALWNYGWNAKNQLVRARTQNHNSALQGYDITNAYDAEGRRFSKKVKRYQSGQIVEQNHITFLHDGNDLIYERHQLPSGLTTCERKYVWGPDISGTHGGVGGAGGLLLIRETKGNSTIDLYPLYDGSGNVVALTDSSGNLRAEYGYGPFGEPLFAKGPNAQSSPFRFATKYFDQETGLCDFGRRPYHPVTNQWLSRDPLGESESLNLYDYGHGDPINNVDVQGLASVSINGSLSTTLETLIPILINSPFDDMDSNSGVGNTVPVPDTPLDVINLALAAVEVQANALPRPETDFSADRSYQIWMMTASSRQLTEAAHSGRFSAAISKEFMKQSQASSNAAHDWKISSGTAQGLAFIGQPEMLFFKGAAAGLVGLKALGRAGSFLDEAVELGSETEYVSSLMGKAGLVRYDHVGATLGIKGGTIWVAPLEDYASLVTRSDAVTASGHAPGVLRAYLKGDPIYGISIPKNSLTLRLPTIGDAGVNTHWRPGGFTGVEHNGIWKNSGVREFVTDGGYPVPKGSVFFSINPDGSWTPIRNY